MARMSDSIITHELVKLAVGGDRGAWDQLMTENRPRLRRMVALRMDPRLQGRIDPSDVIQESYIDAARRLPEYAKNPSLPLFLWLRSLAGQKLVDQHRRHLGARARDAGREVPFYGNACPDASTANIASQFLSASSTPSETAMRVEQNARLEEALNSLEPIDREILALRHFEQLSNGEVAEVLGLDKSAASKRYARALLRLKDVLVTVYGGFEE
jgi:RNA polymerase sigma-70 factor, ECF subfamily